MVGLNIAVLRRGLRLGSQYLLTVRGRKTGEPRSTPVSLATVDGTRYIVAAFADAAWVKNVRVAGSATLARGGKSETVRLVGVARRGPRARPARLPAAGALRRSVLRLTDPDQVAAAPDR